MKIKMFNELNEGTEKLNGYEIKYFKTARGVYANIEIPAINPTFEDDIQVKGFGKTEEEALKSLKSEYNRYKKDPKKYKLKF